MPAAITRFEFGLILGEIVRETLIINGMISTWYHSHMPDGFSLFGTIHINTFSLFLALGSGIGLFWSTWSETFSWERSHIILRNGSIALLGALLGGRIGYLLSNWAYFQDNLKEMAQIWLGGINWVGALVGALIAIFIISQVDGVRFGGISDELLPLFTCIIISVWLASWLTGYAYGKEVDAWWGVPAQNEWGDFAVRWPIQLAGSFSALLIHGLAESSKEGLNIKYPGIATCIEVIGFGVTLFVLSNFRAVTFNQWRGFDLDILAVISIVCLTVIFTIFPPKLITKIMIKNN